MSNIQRVRPDGGWVPASVISQEELEAFDAIRPKLINASDGSVHAPTGDITIGGDHLFRLSGDSRFDAITVATLKAGGNLTIPNTAEFRVGTGGLALVQTGGFIRVALGGKIELQSGGIIEGKSGSEFQIKGTATAFEASKTTFKGLSTLTAEAGSAVNLAGDTTLQNDKWLNLDPPRAWERHGLTIMGSTYVGVPAGSAPDTTDGPSAVKAASNLAGGGDAIVTFPTSAADRYHDIELEDLPDRGELDEVVLTTQGISTVNPGLTLPSYEVFRQKGIAPAESMSDVIQDGHTVANFTSSLVATTVPITSHATINRDYEYFVRVYHAHHATSSGSMWIYDVKASGTSSQMGL